MSGQSGGSLPITSFAVNNFPTADEIILQWHPDINRLEDTTNSTPYAATSTSMFEDIGRKAKAGFKVSFSDYLGRALGYEFVPGPKGGLNVTFSSIVKQSNFLNHHMPFPLLQAAAVGQGDVEFFGLEVPFANTTIYEMTPFEFGAWNGSAKGFTPMEWMGTRLKNGSVVNASACVQGFDRASYMMGLSSSAFNFWYIEDRSNDTEAQFSKRSARSGGRTGAASLSKRGTFPTALLDELVSAFNTSFHLNVSDISYSVIPNPFAGLKSSSPSLRASSELTIVDATEEKQAIPLWGQIQPAHGSNFIIGWDDNEDGAPYQWNNGTNLYDTCVAANASGLPFPIVPTAATFINRNYTHSPVLFGCDVSLTTTNSADSPIVLYLANSPYSAYENFTFIQDTFVPEQISEIFVNSFNILTQGNGTLDAEWPVCLGCAAIDRSLPKVGMQRTQQCEQCFRRYCWNGVSDDSPTGIIDPTLILDPQVDYAEWNKTNPF